MISRIVNRNFTRMLRTIGADSTKVSNIFNRLYIVHHNSSAFTRNISSSRIVLQEGNKPKTADANDGSTAGQQPPSEEEEEKQNQLRNVDYDEYDDYEPRTAGEKALIFFKIFKFQSY